ncbi:recombinase family protein [Shinella sumterensis]|jgi:DNA invertase Pin-like site-specific DNA recombinase|uniref:Recombinase family protein n=1 Tax=Shinella sumterensis TaxID=1967501 RepID=A0AA50CSS8_9HYPH|nr:recombinase family protein [Shinella sumterensis]WLS01391.1 recombinase family protein [Shinella sumterensis]
MLIGYARVSKSDELQNLHLQKDALIGAGVQPENIFEDIASGKADDHPGFENCLKALMPGDVLLLWKLDRVARGFTQLVRTIIDLTNRQVGVKILTGRGAVIDTTTHDGRLVLAVFDALAEFERDQIVARTVAGLASARARGRLGGRPSRFSPIKLRLAISALKEPDTKVSVLCKELGISRATLYRHVSPNGELRSAGVKLLSA